MSIKLEAMRGRQGDRTLYVVLPGNARMDEVFTSQVEPHDDRAQRSLQPKHAQAIGQYILDNRSGYVLGAITYAADVEGTFTPVSEGSPLGVLELPADARLRSVDGQHRRQGIRQAMDALEDVREDNIAVLIYVEDDLSRRRQMFSDMNWTPRRVSASQNVAFDQRDPFSRATQRLARSHELLKGRVEEEQARVARGSTALFTLAAVYDACRRLTLGPSGRLRSYAGIEEEEVVDRSSRFFDLLARREELSRARTAEELSGLRERSILISSTTLRVLAGAVYLCIEHHRKQGTSFTIGSLGPRLAAIDFDPEAELWLTSGFVSPGKRTPNARNQEVMRATNLLAGELLGLRME